MLDRELVEAVKLAREAGQILREVYATDFAVRLKGEDDPVTEADTRVNAFLVGRLRESFPGDSIIAEENGSDPARLSARCWYVDPLDGTKEFIAKNGEFSVMIGLAIDGEARLGVVYQPTENKLYRGVVGDGAFYEVGDKTFQLKVSDIADPAKLRLVVSRSHRPAGTDALKEKLGITVEQPMGSVGLKVGLIASRQADLYVHFSDKTHAWDACAPDAILRAAGGHFVDLAGHSLEYAGGMIGNKRGLLATNRKSYEKILPIVTEVAKASGVKIEEESKPEGA
jgi:3'(2'), 5'-bisphosphate nucleotidase